MKRILSLLLLGGAVAYARARRRRTGGARPHADQKLPRGAAGQIDHAAPAMSSLSDRVGFERQLSQRRPR